MSPDNLLRTSVFAQRCDDKSYEKRVDGEPSAGQAPASWVLIPSVGFLYEVQIPRL